MTNYSKIVENIEADIGHSLKEGDYIPSFSDIMKRFKVSKITAQTAVKHLKDSGSVSFLPGKGYRVAQRLKHITIATYACYRPFNIDITYASTYNAFADECARRNIACTVMYSDEKRFSEIDNCVIVGIFDPKDIKPFEGKNAVLIDAVSELIPSVSFDMRHACRTVLTHVGDAPILLVLPPSDRSFEIERAFNDAAPTDIRTIACSTWYDDGDAKRIIASWKGETIIAFNNIQANLLLRSMPPGPHTNNVFALKKSVNEIDTLTRGVLPSFPEMAAIAVECILNDKMKAPIEISVKGKWVDGDAP